MAPEGRIILIPVIILAALASLGLWYYPQLWLKVTAGVIWTLAIFCMQFFRDPVRIPPDDASAFVSPADGKVVAIVPVDHDEHVGGPAVRLSMFLSVFNVHVQRVPFDSVVDSTRYNKGKMLAAYRQEASEENEYAISYFSSGSGNFSVKQITGAVARRILNYMESNQSVQKGDRLGYIRFGSRVDIVLPANFKFTAQIGDHVKGTKSIIGHF